MHRTPNAMFYDATERVSRVFVCVSDCNEVYQFHAVVYTDRNTANVYENDNKFLSNYKYYNIILYYMKIAM